MKRAFASEIVKCLGVSGSPEVDSSRLPASRRQWERALEWLDHSGIALLFWDRLKVLKKQSAIPSEIGERLERNLADHRLRVAEMAAEFDSINQYFEDARLKYAAMKGLALRPDYCPDLFLRTTYDYDYLLPRESMQTAMEALRAAGYVRKEDPEEHPVVYFHGTHPPRCPLSRDDLYSKAFPRTVELHYLLWDSDQVRIPINLPASPTEQRELRYIPISAYPQGASRLGRAVHFYALSEHDDLIFQVLHIFRHILHDWCRLCSLLDIAYFLDRRASDTAFWNQFLARLSCSRPLCEIVGVVFALASGIFCATIPELVCVEVVRTLRRSLVAWIELYGRHSALNNFSDNKLSLFLHREFIQDESAWRQIRRARLFPIHRPSTTFPPTAGTALARLGAGSKQLVYIIRRLNHHLAGTMRYGLETPFWGRTRYKSLYPFSRGRARGR